MEKYPKFIIEDGHLIMGKVVFHKHLAKNIENVIGGGWFAYNHEIHTFHLYGDSVDFGPAPFDDIIDAIVNKNVCDKVGRKRMFENCSFTVTNECGDIIEV